MVCSAPGRHSGPKHARLAVAVLHTVRCHLTVCQWPQAHAITMVHLVHHAVSYIAWNSVAGSNGCRVPTAATVAHVWAAINTAPVRLSDPRLGLILGFILPKGYTQDQVLLQALAKHGPWQDTPVYHSRRRPTVGHNWLSK